MGNENPFSVFSEIKFFEKGHTYIYKGKKLPSVTTFIKNKFTPEFDKDYWLKYKVLKNQGVRIYPSKEDKCFIINGQKVHSDTIDIDVSELDSQWEDLKKKGLARGNIIHDYLERAWKGQYEPEPIEYLDEFIRLKKKYLKPVYIEGIVADFDIPICGMTDGLFWNRLRGNYQMRDNKTDKEIKVENPYDNMLPPFDFMPDTNFSKYTIQLNIYTWCIEKYCGITIDELYVDHFHNETWTTYIIPKLDLHEIAPNYFRSKGKVQVR